MTAAHTLASIADPPDPPTSTPDPPDHTTPILCAKQMSAIIAPLLAKIAEIVGEDRVVRKMPLILRAFRALNRCDMDRMIRSNDTRSYTIANFALTTLHKACDVLYHAVDHFARSRLDHGALTVQEKRAVIRALTELDRTKWRMVDMIRGWIASADPVIGPALIDACADNAELTAVYGCVIEGSFFCGSPWFSMDVEDNCGWSEEEVFDHCFVDPEIRGFIRANCAREYRMNICGESAKDVFGKQVAESAMDHIVRLGDENAEMRRKIGENERMIGDWSAWLDGIEW
jgi:hypothetical protein